MSKRAAIYARVSCRGKQDHENQLRQLREFCGNHPELELVAEYVDEESGATPERDRFRDLFDDAHRRRFDVVVFWALDRFSREGTLPTLSYLQELDRYGVAVVSYTERYLDTIGPFRDVVISLLATMAKQERIKISERTKAGLERARAQGKRIGRPPVEEARPKLEGRVLELREKGWGIHKIRRELQCGTTTVQRILEKAAG